jgi:Cu/Zn superoxide dismutase
VKIKKTLAKAVIEVYMSNAIKGTLELSEEKDKGLSSFSILNHCIVLFSHADDYETQPIGSVGQRIVSGKILTAE